MVATNVHPVVMVMKMMMAVAMIKAAQTTVLMMMGMRIDGDDHGGEDDGQ